MEQIIVHGVEDLFLQCRGHNDIKIYGAKTIAQRACHYLESRGGGHIEAFLVSNKYENPQVLQGKPVLRIEEITNEFDCVIVAVSDKFVWDVVEKLQAYNISKLVIISPMMDDDFPTSCLVSSQSRISTKAFMAEKIQIVCDDTSTIMIEDNVIIQSGAIILATDHSHIHIGKGAWIGEKVFISADEESEINISQDVYLGEKTRHFVKKSSQIIIEGKSCVAAETEVHAKANSRVLIGKETCVGKRCVVNAIYDSQIKLAKEIRIGGDARIGATMSGKITIGSKTTANDFLYIGCDSSLIQVGEDNMFSYYVKMNVGSHKLMDRTIEKEITNYHPICTENHVWIGMGATLLPGCTVGNGSIIGAASVVNSQIPNNAICAGNVARVIRENIEWDRDDPPEI